MQVTTARLDDIPLIIGVLKRLGLAELYDQTVGDHGLHTGLSGGWLATLWLAHILSRGNHAKAPVREWVEQHQAVLEPLIGQSIRATDFTDDRLSSLLRRLSDPARWAALEAGWWARSLAVLPSLDPSASAWPTYHLDSTTTWGYHIPQPDGLMRRGQSKDHRADLPQLKLMTLADQRRGYLLFSQVHPGQAADEPLYGPLIERARQVLGRPGLVFVGDTKMATLTTRADVVAHGDYYLTVLPQRKGLQDQLPIWLGELACGQRATAALVVAGERLGVGFEIEREMQANPEENGPAQAVSWTERMLVFRSDALAAQKVKFLHDRLARAEARLRALAPPPAPGQRAWRDEAKLRQKAEAILAEQDVAGLLTGQVQAVAEPPPAHGRGSRSPARMHFVITQVQRDAAAIAAAEAALAWRVQVTNVPASVWSMSECIWQYRQNAPSERNYHLLKGEPLSISPLYVHTPAQIAGMTYVLTLAVRLMRLIELKVAQHLEATHQTVDALYAGQPKRTSAHPTAVALLSMLERAQITLTDIRLPGTRHLHLSPLPPVLPVLLTALDLPADLYTRFVTEPVPVPVQSVALLQDTS